MLAILVLSLLLPPCRVCVLIFVAIAAVAIAASHIMNSLAWNEHTATVVPQINDALLRTLDAEREGTPIAVEDIGGDGAKGAPSLLDLDGGTEDPFVGKVSSPSQENLMF